MERGMERKNLLLRGTSSTADSLCTSQNAAPRPRDGQSPAALIDRRAVEEATTLSRSTLYRLIARGHFPRPVSISANRRAWRVAEVEEWLRTRC